MIFVKKTAEEYIAQLKSGKRTKCAKRGSRRLVPLQLVGRLCAAIEFCFADAEGEQFLMRNSS